MNGTYEMAATNEPVIALNHRVPALRGRVLSNAIYHGIIHKLLPEKKEWWVWMAGHIMARGGDDGQECPCEGHTYDEMPDRDSLLALLRRATRKFNRRKRK